MICLLMTQAFLFEVYSDEIPANLQWDAYHRIRRHIDQALKSEELIGNVQGFCSLRRVGFLILEMDNSAERSSFIKGPSAKAPDYVIEKFLHIHGSENCYQQKNSKGDVWVAKNQLEAVEKKLHRICVDFLEHFYWQKRMHWHKTDDFSWIRPIHSLLCTLDDKQLNWTFRPDGLCLSTKNTTPGHPALCENPLEKIWISVPQALDYKETLKQKNLWVCPLERFSYLQGELRTLAQNHGYQVFEEDLASNGLLGEVSGMTEWPKVFLASFSEDFLKLPSPFLLTTLKHHQRCFPLKIQEQLAPHFIVVLDGKDPTLEVQRGHQRVAEARLSDALFFWNQDLRQPLARYNQHLKEKVFFEGLGTMLQKVRRLEVVATKLDKSGALSAAAALSKADLATQAVREFPELQGIMGKYYALAQDIDPLIAEALEEQYFPLTPNQDLKNQSCLGGWLGMIDRMDTLVGFFSIGKYPTSSKDPMALRRGAYGWVRLAVQHPYPFSISESIRISLESYRNTQKMDSLSHKDSLDLLEQLIFKQFSRYLEEHSISREIAEAVGTFRFSKSLKELFVLADELRIFLQEDAGIAFLSAYKRMFFLLHQDKEYLTEFGVPKDSELTEPQERQLWSRISTPWNKEYFMKNALGFSQCIHQFLDTLPVKGVPSRIGLLAGALRYTRPLGNLLSLFTPPR
ncbi:glycine--tRNA ligase beta subunit [Holospora elegans E1]|uniref:glycine--tRNA ligase n=1 Tax=Holospora elegans E1 TaxID=1427503 RepID=A0A023E0Q9_9PROT|nr:glycine--tRNA ligase subunit beta [Holospora elegans]GAJ46652.1 glycine--tRNA ligase beta subunit [Holospora elegans E1]